MESTDDIKSVVIKEECDDDFEFPDYVSTSITPLATENHLQGVKDYDASIKIEEQGVQVFKEEVTEETTTKEVETVYLLEQPFKKSLRMSMCLYLYTRKWIN